MVKRLREKQYQSAREHREYSQIRSGSAVDSASSTIQRRLPFSHCALTLTPYVTPVCTKHGIVFENSAIVPFLHKHNYIDPVTGESLSRDKGGGGTGLITLHMDQNEQTGEWQCPILQKAFADHTKIVAIVCSGNNQVSEANVYSWDAYSELNVKAKNYTDLISGEPFDPRSGVIVLNDPTNEEFNRLRDINTFYHIRNARKLKQEEEEETGNNNSNIKHSVTATRILDKLKQKKEATQQQQQQQQKSKTATTTDALSSSATNNNNNPAIIITKDNKRIRVLVEDVLSGVQYTTGQGSGSFTSTSLSVAHTNAVREATQEEILQAQFHVMKKHTKKKGYVKLHTNLGIITIELHCDIVPRTCTNFLGLCQAGKYDNTIFHRLIPNFMIQGGSSSSSRTKGGNDNNKKHNKNDDDNDDTSLWGDAFVDEFDDRLKHTGSGIVSMANAGPNTNKRQFFITFKSCTHLDRKHSIFGQVIGDVGVLKQMEKTPTDSKDRPKSEIKIIKTEVLVDPAEEARLMELERLEKLHDAREAKNNKNTKPSSAVGSDEQKKTDETKKKKSLVGKYLQDKLEAARKNNSSLNKKTNDVEIPSVLPSAKFTTTTTAPAGARPSKKKKNSGFGDFSSW